MDALINRATEALTRVETLIDDLNHKTNDPNDRTARTEPDSIPTECNTLLVAGYLQPALVRLREQFESLQKEINDTAVKEEQLTDAHHRIEEINGELTNAKSNLQLNEATLQSSREENAKQKKCIEVLANDLSIANGDLNLARNKYEILDHQFNTAKKVMYDQKSRHDDELQKKQVTIDKLIEETSTLRDRAQSSESTLKEWQVSIESKEQKITRLNESVDSLSSDKTALTAKIALLEASNENPIGDAHKPRAQNRTDVEDREANMVSLQKLHYDALKLKQTEIDGLDKMLYELAEENVKLHAQLQQQETAHSTALNSQGQEALREMCEPLQTKDDQIVRGFRYKKEAARMAQLVKRIKAEWKVRAFNYKRVIRNTKGKLFFVKQHLQDRFNVDWVGEDPDHYLFPSNGYPVDIVRPEQRPALDPTGGDTEDHDIVIGSDDHVETESRQPHSPRYLDPGTMIVLESHPSPSPLPEGLESGRPMSPVIPSPLPSPRGRSVTREREEAETSSKSRKRVRSHISETPEPVPKQARHVSPTGPIHDRYETLPIRRTPIPSTVGQSRALTERSLFAISPRRRHRRRSRDNQLSATVALADGHGSVLASIEPVGTNMEVRSESIANRTEHRRSLPSIPTHTLNQQAERLFSMMNPPGTFPTTKSKS